ncbi:MAG: peptidoglycan-binding protein [Defluviitaleaceae bacterium]|nr:peptidoglycan-binding protein [Defluviitaleaceae bacterium]
MGRGILRLQVVSAEGAILISNAEVTITDHHGTVLHRLNTDNTGHIAEIELEAPDISLTEDPHAKHQRYTCYNITVKAPGYNTAIYNGVMIFDQSTSVQVIELHPILDGRPPETEVMEVAGHALCHPELPEPQDDPPSSRILRDVVIPQYITVHLGRPTVSAPNVRVPFIEYIKNVTSHEIFDTWPEQTIIANVYCIVSLTLNRIFTEFYRKQGRSFDITNSTTIDQKYVHGGTIGARISAIVDRIFNHYLAVVGHQEPFLALYNDGIVANFPGRLSQWGSFYDGRDRGMNAWQIINKYYRQNLELRESNNFTGALESWPGSNLSTGSSGEHVRTMQRYLNRILGRHTDIIINPVDGVFGASTAHSVRTFQRIYNLPQTGVIDRATWFQISRIYAIEKGLWEMDSEGIRIGIGTTPPTQIIREGNTGRLVTELQFLLDYIGYFYDDIPFVADTSRFDSLTTTAVRAFQRHFGLNPDGIVGPITWRKLYDVYWGIHKNIERPQPAPPPVNPPGMPPYPGTALRVGSTGENVRRVQQALNRLAHSIPGISELNVDGNFGPLTQTSVMAFQRIFGLNVDGVVGPITWERLFREYLDLQPGGQTPTPPTPTPLPPFPGTPIRQGDRGENVRLIQNAINRLVPCNPGRLWQLTEDGNFGAMTRDAIFTFQSIFSMPITGVVDATTWDLLMSKAAECQGGGGGGGGLPPFPGQDIREGATGESVRQIQDALSRLSRCQPRLWIMNVDGNFGAGTRDGIFTFQSIFGLPITGVVNSVTWERLMREASNCTAGGSSGGGGGTQPSIPPYPGSPLRFGNQGESVRQIQRAINHIAPRHPGRLWIIPESGIFGEQTRDAIFAFQSIFGLGIDGIVGPNTWNRLMQEASQDGVRSISPLTGLFMASLRRGRF